MTPSDIWAAAGPAATRATSPRTSIRAMRMRWLLRVRVRVIPKLYPKVFVQPLHAGGERRVGDHVHHSPVLHDVMAVGHRGGGVGDLLDQPDREDRAPEPPQGAGRPPGDEP